MTVSSTLPNLRRLIMVATLASCSAAVGCLPLDPVNQPPGRPSITGPATVARSQSGVAYHVTTEDPDGDELALSWGHFNGPCPADIAAWLSGPRPSATASGATYTMATPDAVADLCVWVIARDPNGAESAAMQQVAVENLRPVALIDANMLQTAGPRSLYEEVRLSAVGSSDADASDTIVSYSWQVTPPGGQPFVGAPCADAPSGEAVCFMPPAAGTYTVTLIVFDNLGAPSDSATRAVVVAPDRPPCLRDTDFATAVRLRSFSEAVAFNVAVDDDGDPYPPRENASSKLRFEWSLRDGQGDEQSFIPLVQSEQAASLRLAANRYRQGDTVQVRVEVFDRTHDKDLACPANSELCESTTGCTQRLTFTVRYWL